MVHALCSTTIRAPTSTYPISTAISSSSRSEIHPALVKDLIFLRQRIYYDSWRGEELFLGYNDVRNFI